MNRWRQCWRASRKRKSRLPAQSGPASSKHLRALLPIARGRCDSCNPAVLALISRCASFAARAKRTIDMLNAISVARLRAAAVILIAGCAVAASDAGAAARETAPAYPTKPLRLLVPFTPGGSQDVTARLVSTPVQQSIGQNIVVDNRPGSGGLIATQEGARGTPDGHTLLL